jgi:hypothetical protein
MVTEGFLEELEAAARRYDERAAHRTETLAALEERGSFTPTRRSASTSGCGG